MTLPRKQCESDFRATLYKTLHMVGGKFRHMNFSLDVLEIWVMQLCDMAGWEMDLSGLGEFSSDSPNYTFSSF